MGENNENIRSLAEELSELTGQKIGVEHIHPNKEDRYYYIQAPEPGVPLLLNHYRGPFFIDIHPDDYAKLVTGWIPAHEYIITAKWQVGYFWGGGSMLNGGYYQPLDIVGDKEKVRRYLKVLSCRGHFHSSGYMPSKETCSNCFVKNCSFSKYNTGNWDNEISEPDPRFNLFNSLRKRFEKDNPGYTFRGFLCGDIPENEIWLNPTSHYTAEDPFELTAYASRNIIRALLTREIEPENWEEYAYAFKFKIHKLFESESLAVTPETLMKAFEGLDYVKKESNTEPVNDMYDEKVPLMARISAFFKKMF